MKRGLGRLLRRVRGKKREKREERREKREVSYALASFLFEFRELI